MSPPKKVHNTDVPNLTFDVSRGQWRWRNRQTNKRKYLIGADKTEAEDLARRLNTAVDLLALKQQQDRHGVLTVEYVIRAYESLIVPDKPWEASTLKNQLAALNLYCREMGDKYWSAMDRVFLADWISQRCTTFDCRSKHRTRWIDLYRFAISRKWSDVNEAEAVYQGSGSLKIPANQRKRRRLTVEWFNAIHEQAEPFVQMAMRFSLITLQSRAEIVNAKHADITGDHLRVIRKKVAGTSDMAFIKIKITTELRELIRQSRFSGTNSPYIVHTVPRSLRPQARRNKPHWTYVNPDHLSKRFAAARTATGFFDDMPTQERPTFHEIRSLGARCYRELGYDERYIQYLATHANRKTTKIYLENPENLEDQHFIEVNADLSLKELPNI